MAQVYSEQVTITISRLVKNGEELSPVVTDEFTSNVEAIAQELLKDTGALVEVSKDNG